MKKYTIVSAVLLAVVGMSFPAAAQFTHTGDTSVDGNFGVGTDTPAQRIHLVETGTNTPRIRYENASGLTNISANHQGFFIGGGAGVLTLLSSKLGIGTFAPVQPLHVNTQSASSARFRFENSNGLVEMGTQSGSFLIWTAGSFAVPAVTVDSAGNMGIGTTNPGSLLDVDGTATVNVLEIQGGADLSEKFTVRSQADIAVEPGMVVAIDPAHPGNLLVTSKAYDRTVAGIISGANGLSTGMLMGQSGSIANGAHPVALTGRVYCKVDASYGAIQPGDLLTTSATPGHAMKVSDHTQAQGAILGKAMTQLSEGQGMVLVLVSLQ